jgi:hypothetical protein
MNYDSEVKKKIKEKSNACTNANEIRRRIKEQKN